MKRPALIFFLIALSAIGTVANADPTKGADRGPNSIKWCSDFKCEILVSVRRSGSTCEAWVEYGQLRFSKESTFGIQWRLLPTADGRKYAFRKPTTARPEDDPAIELGDASQFRFQQIVPLPGEKLRQRFSWLPNQQQAINTTYVIKVQEVDPTSKPISDCDVFDPIIANY